MNLGSQTIYWADLVRAPAAAAELPIQGEGVVLDRSSELVRASSLKEAPEPSGLKQDVLRVQRELRELRERCPCVGPCACGFVSHGVAP